MSSRWSRPLALVILVLLLVLAWWGWHRGGLALMQLGMGVC
ncbi:MULTISPECIES: hypothetical protein [Pseudomonas]|uniref:Uncharacterized protein n=1 Tax=Pseudomonas asplenii TaxID=53407 RepID=A0A0M9GGY1_9PSED|nr:MULTISPECIES: hypothetical protein [Pseudomonas]KPA90965.1 hypothetical protein PF66_03042 [Pseudomonas fuscovaginae]KPA97710.1 hypothetical protein PF70_02228 [Pseudomonas fuscovaginae]